ncbi:MAG: MBL fold metallo-hydrolase [Syntrophaceticus schinkii]
MPVFTARGKGYPCLRIPLMKSGLPSAEKRVDVVTVSHDHYDHNAVSFLPGEPVVIKEAGKHPFRSLEFNGISVFHDEVKGARRARTSSLPGRWMGCASVILGIWGICWMKRLFTV